jgi:hypothetical protein
MYSVLHYGDQNQKHHLGNLGIDGTIILKGSSAGWDGMEQI